MAYRVLTINREFGSGGGRIAQTIAKWLGWKLLDRNIIDAIAYSAHVDADVVQHYDEHVDSWLRRLNQQAMRSAALAAGLELRDGMIFDAAQMVRITEKILEQAWTEGNCVIVGRASQCVLQHKRGCLSRLRLCSVERANSAIAHKAAKRRRHRRAHPHRGWRAREIPAAIFRQGLVQSAPL